MCAHCLGRLRGCHCTLMPTHQPPGLTKPTVAATSCIQTPYQTEPPFNGLSPDIHSATVLSSHLVLVPRETRDRCAVSLTERGVLTSCYTYSCRIRVRVTKVSICIYPISISASLSLLTHIHTDTRSPTRATATSLPLKCTRTHTCRSMPRPGPDGIAVSSVRRTIDPFPACVS